MFFVLPTTKCTPLMQICVTREKPSFVLCGDMTVRLYRSLGTALLEALKARRTVSVQEIVLRLERKDKGINICSTPRRPTDHKCMRLSATCHTKQAYRRKVPTALLGHRRSKVTRKHHEKA